ncbi:hypothetical protein EMCRGX_G025973 [Ephydatia muelleri]
MTSDKEDLTDYDIEHLMNDTNGALWRPPIAASQVTPNRKMTPVPPIAASQVTKPGPDAPKWGFSQQAQPWSKQTVDDYENMETQMPSEEIEVQPVIKVSKDTCLGPVTAGHLLSMFYIV